MKTDHAISEAVIEKLLAYVWMIKTEILGDKRSEHEYPVSLAVALGYLQSAHPEVSASRLESERWDQTHIGRKWSAKANGYLFFMPGDEHFAELPPNEKEYVKLLFQLERRQLLSQSGAGSRRETTASPSAESLEMTVRAAYERLMRKTRGATYVRIPDLRREMGLPKSSFDSGLIHLRDKGIVILSKHSYAASLSPDDLACCIELSPGEYYYYLEFRQG